MSAEPSDPASDAPEGNGKPRSWKQDPEAVKADILAAARTEFSAHGLSGARIQNIVDRTRSSKRMIFYYFGDKEGLYLAVLEDAYRRIRSQEKELDLSGLSPVKALETLVEFTFEHHRENPDFIRLVMIENIHDGRHMERIASMVETNRAAIDKLAGICAEGVSQGLFRPDVSPLLLHWQISALSFFNVANRATFGMIFGRDIFAEEGQEALRAQTVRSVLDTVLLRAD